MRKTLAASFAALLLAVSATGNGFSSNTGPITIAPNQYTNIGYNSTQAYTACVWNLPLPTPSFVGYFLILQGSATKVIRVQRIALSGSATTGGSHTFGASLLTTVTGGTPTVVVPSLFDTNSPAPTAVVRSYATGTTPGSVTSTVFRSWTLFMPALTSVVEPTAITETWVYGQQSGPTLRGTSQFFALTLVGAAPAGAAMNACIDWTEWGT